MKCSVLNGFHLDKRGVRKKVDPVLKAQIFLPILGLTETYYIPNQWKLNKDFAELCRFEITALIE